MCGCERVSVWACGRVGVWACECACACAREREWVRVRVRSSGSTGPGRPGCCCPIAMLTHYGPDFGRDGRLQPASNQRARPSASRGCAPESMARSHAVVCILLIGGPACSRCTGSRSDRSGHVRRAIHVAHGPERAWASADRQLEVSLPAHRTFRRNEGPISGRLSGGPFPPLSNIAVGNWGRFDDLLDGIETDLRDSEGKLDRL